MANCLLNNSKNDRMEVIESNINMYSGNIAFEDREFFVDSFISKQGTNSILPILLEEQPATWQILSNELMHSDSKTNVLDVGTGSGFWAIMIKSTFPNYEVYALDKNEKAIKVAKQNAMQNNANINFLLTNYKTDNYQKNFFDYIILTPPYHIYPPVVEQHIPFFARGGYDGQTEFKSQLSIASYHLKDGGKILFNMMCLGSDTRPNYCEYIPAIFNKTIEIKYYNIFPKIESSLFLDNVYPGCFQKFKDDLVKQFPYIYYTCGILKKSNYTNIVEGNRSVDFSSRTWKDRFALHQEINKF